MDPRHDPRPPARRGLSPARYARITTVALVSLGVIVVTGAGVRLTGSGLGCSDWPTCEQDQFHADLEFHAMIEFGNRLFTGVVSAAVILAVLGALARRPRRPDLTRWSLGLVAGVIGQVVLGAVLVLSHLDPRFTLGHFLLSMVLVWNATVLADRARLGDPLRTVAVGSTALRRVVAAASVVGVALLVTGTLVTGSGPNGGDERAERLPFLIHEVTRVHTTVAFTLLALVVAAWFLAIRDGLPLTAGRARAVVALIVVQGTVGYAQYFSGIPPLLVAVHILLATVTWVMVVRLHLSLRLDASGPEPSRGRGAPPARAEALVGDPSS